MPVLTARRFSALSRVTVCPGMEALPLKMSMTLAMALGRRDVDAVTV